MKDRILIIDGNFLAHRCIGILNQGENVNHLKTHEERLAFKTALRMQLYYLWKSFSKYCDNFVIVSDSNSWRKDIQPFEPYYALPGAVLGYKAQRAETHDKSEIDYDTFYYLWKEFVEEMESFYFVISVERLEGDDLIKLISDKLPNKDKVIFANDGDLEQLISKNVVMYRNVRSKICPDGEIIVSNIFYKQYLSAEDNRTKLLQNSGNQDRKNLMYVNLFDDKPIPRQLHSGIKISQPFITILTKSICGDQSDNILPIIKWKAKTGTRMFSVKDKHIEETLQNQFKKLTEQSAFELLKLSGNEETHLELLEFIKDLLVVCKQPFKDDFAKKVMNHYLHNLRLVFINPDFFPKDSLEQFDMRYHERSSVIENEIMNLEKLAKTLGFESEDNIQFEDKVSTLFKKSINHEQK
jgi:hypothetical protein